MSKIVRYGFYVAMWCVGVVICAMAAFTAKEEFGLPQMSVLFGGLWGAFAILAFTSWEARR